MKKSLLALFASSSILAFAQDPCCEPCEPCCVPQPKKCIDRVCYTPPFYDLQCAWGTSVEVDFLYWFARENNLPYALEITRQATNPGLSTQSAYIPVESKYLSTAWKPGVRVGLGWDGDYDGWDSALTWTWYKNQKKGRTDVSFQTVPALAFVPILNTNSLINPWVNQSIINNDFPVPLSGVRAKWNLLFNQIDWEMGKKYWLGRHFTMRPYAGIRGAWTKIHFETRSNVTISTTSSFNSYQLLDSFENDYWGVGLVAGFQPSWFFGCNNAFSIFANLDASLIYGKQLCKKKESYQELINTFSGFGLGSTQAIAFRAPSRSDSFRMQPILDFALGFSWGENWCCDRYRTEIDIGWEQHIWFKHGQRMISTDSLFDAPSVELDGFSSYDRIVTNLDFGGVFVNFRFDF